MLYSWMLPSLLSCWSLQCAAVLFVDENEHVDVGCLKKNRSISKISKDLL